MVCTTLFMASGQLDISTNDHLISFLYSDCCLTIPDRPARGGLVRARFHQEEHEGSSTPVYMDVMCMWMYFGVYAYVGCSVPPPRSLTPPRARSAARGKDDEKRGKANWQGNVTIKLKDLFLPNSSKMGFTPLPFLLIFNNNKKHQLERNVQRTTAFHTPMTERTHCQQCWTQYHQRAFSQNCPWLLAKCSPFLSNTSLEKNPETMEN